MPTKFCIVKAMVFPVVIYGCESWTIKKAECQRIDAFKLWCWRRLLRVPWTASKSNQSILKEISPEYSLEGLILKLKHQYFGHLSKELTHWKRPWWWERLKAGEEGNDRGWDGRMASQTQWKWVWVNSKSWWWTRRPGMLQSMELQRVGHDWGTELIATYSKVTYRMYIGPCLFFLIWTEALKYFSSSCKQHSKKMPVSNDQSLGYLKEILLKYCS